LKAVFGKIRSKPKQSPGMSSVLGTRNYMVGKNRDVLQWGFKLDLNPHKVLFSALEILFLLKKQEKNF
jgi:hypothetical protein